MRLSLDWLSDHVDLGGKSPQEIAELLTLHTAEVDGVLVPGGGWPGITVARVVATRPHPNADRLRLATLETATGSAEVVCGAPNIAPGQKICFAPSGTRLPDGTVLERRKIRGVESGGMALSAKELGLSDDHEGIVVLPEETPVGQPVAQALRAGAIFEIDNTAITSRPDLWGHYGFARELSAILARPLRPLDLGAARRDYEESGPPRVGVELEAGDLCPRYLGWRIGGVRVGPSPDWLRRRLESVGQRPINNVVDLTNYVQLECGQPLHAFDARQVAEGRIVVRRAQPRERVTTLDGQPRDLPEGALVIADPVRALAIAGVMGLENSEVREETTEILLEVAHFAMTSIRATSKALGLRTEAASRFEKGLDPEGVPVAAMRFLKLLRDVVPEARPLGGPRDARTGGMPPPRISCPEGWIARRLGVPLPREEEDAILGRLGFAVERARHTLTVTVPSWRAGGDVSIPEDLVEEVGRIRGYDRIPPVPLVSPLEPVPAEPERAARRRLRESLSLGSGFTEIHAYPFATADEFRRAGMEPPSLAVANAAQPGLDLLATSLVPALLKSAAHNLKYRDEAAIYLVAPVFLEGEPRALPRENERVALLLARRGGAAPIFELKGAVEALLRRFRVRGARVEQGDAPAWLHPGRAARFGRGREAYGWFGELHPKVRRAFEIDAATAIAELDVDALRDAPRDAGRMEPISRYPTVPFDVAVVLDRKEAAASVEETIRKAARERIRSVRLFDAYEGTNLPAGKKSLAFHVVFGSFDHTLEPAEADGLRRAVTAALEKRGWSIRA